MRTVANKSKMKVAIIQAIDRKVALDDIAMSKGIEFEELLDEIEAIVYSGTKLNIDYFLEDIMDELQRWYDFNVFYSSPDLIELRFSMDIMKYKEVSEIFELMEKIKKVSFSVNGNNVILK